MTIGFSKSKQLHKKEKAVEITQAPKRKRALVKRKPLKLMSAKQKKELAKRAKLKRELVEESEGLCMTCKKKPRDGIGLSLSHIVPLSRGGKTTYDNCLVEDDSCHRKYEKHPERRPEWQQVRAGIKEV